jgi:hypothetical protein
VAFLALTIQHWVSGRWRAFSVAAGIGIVTLIAGCFAVAASQNVEAWPQYTPWALPMLVLARQPHNIEAALRIGAAAGAVAAAARCWEFCRREAS